jgi:transposase
MFIDIVPNRESPPAVLLRESFRDADGKTQKRTLANLSKLPSDAIEMLKALLKGGTMMDARPEELSIERSLPHGHVAAVLGTIRKLGLDRLIGSKAKDAASRRYCDLVLAMMVDRLITPRSKLGFVRAVDERTAVTSLGEVLDLGKVKDNEPYDALDWLLEQQIRIENGLARRHLKDGMLVLYDVSSSYFEGRHCPLAHYGHTRDHRGDRLQIVYGLLCTREGLPIAIEVFEGNTADPKTLKSQVDKLKARFAIKRVVMVGDRGMITSARIRDDLTASSLDWISCLRAPQIQALASDHGPLQLSLFDDRDLAEITSPDFPGERLIVCRNRELANERARKREALLKATERELARIQAQLLRKGSHRRSAVEISLAVGKVVNAKKMAKHFVLDIRDGHLCWSRKTDQIAAEAKLDGIYVIRTSVPVEDLDTANAVQSYKDLSRVERAFRSMKTIDLEIRPIRHWNADRVRAHVCLCMLAYHVEWHLRQALAPLLFHDTDLEVARAKRSSPVVKTEPSPSVQAKKAIKRNANGDPVHSFTGLIDHLGSMTRNTMRMPQAKKHPFTLLSKSTPLQDEAFKLLGVDPMRVQ